MVNHPKYGWQYNVDTYEIKVPTDNESLVMYLSSGIFKGIGEKTAKRIVDKFGSETIEILKNEVDLVATVKGMTLKKAELIRDKILSSEMNQELIVKLNTYGFTIKESISLVNIYGLDILNIVNDDIYELINEISFDKLDFIFLNIHDEMHEYRIKALIKHCIYTFCFETGDTIVSKEEIFLRMKKKFNSNFNSDMYLIYLNKLIESSEIVLVDDYITLFEFYDTEKNIMTNINRINNISESLKDEKIEDNEYLQWMLNNNSFDSSL